MQTIIGIVGPIGSGKGVLSRYFEEHFNAVIISAPVLLKEILGLINIPTTRPNLQECAEFICETYGPHVLHAALLKRYVTPETKLVVIDGVRYVAQVDYYRSLPDTKFILLAVDAPPEVCYKRACQRNQYPGEGVVSFEQFQMICHHPVESQVPYLMRIADFRIDSTGTKEALVEAARALMGQILA